MSEEKRNPREALPQHRRSVAQLCRLLDATGEAAELPYSPVRIGSYNSARIHQNIKELPIGRAPAYRANGTRFRESFSMRDQRTIVEHTISLWPSHFVREANRPPEVEAAIRAARARWLDLAKQKIVSSEFLD